MVTKQMILRLMYTLIILTLLIVISLLFIQYLFPLFLAYLFSLTLLPFIRFIHQRFHLPYLASCVVGLFVAIISILLFLFFIGLEIINGIVYLAKWMPEYIQFLSQELSRYFQLFLQPIVDKVNIFLQNLSSEEHTLIEGPLEEINNSLKEYIVLFVEDMLYWLSSSLASLTGSVTILMFTLLCTFFICKDWDHIHHFIIKMSPEVAVKIVFDIYSQLKEKVMKYLLAQLQLIFITFAMLFTAFSILQIKHALTIALIIAMIDLLPILGTGLVFLPWAFYLFITNNYTLAIMMLTLYLIIITVRQILEPKFVSNAIGIHPLFTIMAIYLGYQLFDFKGIWVGPAILFFIKAGMDANVFQSMFRYIKYNRFNVGKW